MKINIPFICHNAELTELKGYKLTINKYLTLLLLQNNKNILNNYLHIHIFTSE